MTDEMTFVYQNITSYKVMLQLVLLQRTESNEQTKTIHLNLNCISFMFV